MLNERREGLARPSGESNPPTTRTPGSAESWAVAEELGDIYFSCDAYSQAERQYRQVLGAAGEHLAPAAEASLHLKIARSLQRQGTTGEVIRELESAQAALDRSPTALPALQGRVAATYAFVHRQRGEYSAAAEKCHEAFRFLAESESEDEQERAEVELVLGTVYLRQGDLHEAERWYKKALVGMSRSASGEGMVKALNNLGLVYRNLGHWDRSVEYFERGIDAAEKIGHYSTIAVCSANLGLVHYHRGDWPRAETCLRRSMAIYRDTGYMLGVVTANLGLGRLHTTLHAWEEARRCLEEALRLARERCFRREILIGREFLGDYHLERGEVVAAEIHYREGLELAREMAPRSDHVAELSRRMGELEIARGNPLAALPCLEEALQIAGEIHDRREEAIIHRALAEAHAANGDRERAKARLSDALAKLRRLGERFELGKALLAAGMILAEPGAAHEAEQRSAQGFLKEAREIFETLGVKYLVARVKFELSRWEEQWGAGTSSAVGAGGVIPLAAATRRTGAGRASRPTLRESVGELERRLIVNALRDSGGNQTRAALLLGLTRKGLLNKMRRYAIRTRELAGQLG